MYLAERPSVKNAKDWLDKEWADGDIIMLVFTNPILKWFWNGVEQSCIDVSEENDLISSEFLTSFKNRVRYRARGHL